MRKWKWNSKHYSSWRNSRLGHFRHEQTTAVSTTQTSESVWTCYEKITLFFARNQNLVPNPTTVTYWFLCLWSQLFTKWGLSVRSRSGKNIECQNYKMSMREEGIEREGEGEHKTFPWNASFLRNPNLIFNVILSDRTEKEKGSSYTCDMQKE